MKWLAISALAVAALGSPGTAAGVDDSGFVLADTNGGLTAHGGQPPVPDVEGTDIVGVSLTPDGRGAWFAAADGHVLATGTAPPLGSLTGYALNAPVVGIAATPSGRGYWLVALDGGVFTFGDADFFGSTGDLVLNDPVVNMAPTRSGRGYWLVALDGGVFAFGDAEFHGSMGAVSLNRPVASIVTSPTGDGYLLVALDGGIFTFGDAEFHGSLAGTPPSSQVVAAVPTETGDGYWLATARGEVRAFGDAPAIAGRETASDLIVGLATPWASSNAGGPLLVGLVGGVTGIGDSVLWVSGNELMRAVPEIEMDIHAAIGRTFPEGLSIARSIAANESLRETVIIGLGTNGPMSQSGLDEILDLVGADRRILLVNVRIPRSWEHEVNARLAAAAASRPNTEVVDWHAHAIGRPDWFISDGYHPNDAGIAQYVSLVADALGFDVAPDDVVADEKYLADIGEE